MRMLRPIVTLCLAFSLAAAPAFAAEAPNPRTMKFPPLKFQLPKPERFVLENGMVVYLQEEHELPLVAITAYVRTGSNYEPEDKNGLAGITGAVMRSGGVEGIAPEKLDEELEFMASSVEAAIGGDNGFVSMNTLKRNFDRTLELFGKVMMKPAFREDRLELAKKRTVEGLRRQNDDPKGVADRELQRAIYVDSPLGRFPTIPEVQKLTRQDLVDFHAKFYAPNTVILAVSGDITKQELESKLKKVFGSWQKREVKLPEVKPPHEVKPEVLLVHKDVNQSVIRMGHLGIDKNNPDLHAIKVMDYILGGSGLNSRMMTEIRTKQGLAYNAEAAFDVGRVFPGMFLAETETKAGTTAKAAKIMLDIMKEMTEKPVTDEELSLAKESIVNSFIFGFAKPDAVVTQRARLEYYDYPEGYLETYRDRIARVTKEDVLRVAKKYLHPEALTIVIVGNEKLFDKPLSEFGKVREVKLKQ